MMESFRLTGPDGSHRTGIGGRYPRGRPPLVDGRSRSASCGNCSRLVGAARGWPIMKGKSLAVASFSAIQRAPYHLRVWRCVVKKPATAKPGPLQRKVHSTTGGIGHRRQDDPGQSVSSPSMDRPTDRPSVTEGRLVRGTGQRCTWLEIFHELYTTLECVYTLGSSRCCAGSSAPVASRPRLRQSAA